MPRAHFNNAAKSLAPSAPRTDGKHRPRRPSQATLRHTLSGFFAIALAFTLLTGGSVVLAPKGNNAESGTLHPAANGIMGEKKNSIDVLFIGDSETFSSFSPLQIWGEQGFSSYVCATSAQQLSYGKTLLDRALKSQQPRVVVFETDSIFKPLTISEATFRTAQDTFPILEFHNRWKTLEGSDLTTPAQATWVDPLKGFRINTKVKPADASKYMEPSNKVAPLSPINYLYLQVMVQTCKSRGITPLLVSTPSTVNWNFERHNAIAEIAQQLDVTYLDLNEGPNKVDIDWNHDTYDAGDHLNLAGATKVSSNLGAYLKKTYKLEDKRSSEGYASWNEDQMRYKAKIEREAGNLP